MNVDRGKESFSEQEIEELRAKLLSYKESNGYSWAALGQKTGIAVGTISQWGPGVYAGDNAKIAAKVHRFFMSAQTMEALEERAPLVPGFQPTKTARRIHSMLNWAKRGKFIMIPGDPGLGKTAAIDQYAASHPNVWKITLSPASGAMNPMLLTLLRGMGGVRQHGSGHILSATIRERVLNRDGLIVIDEAQWLEPKALEELRAIHDETKVGLALAGNREVLTRVEGQQRTTAFAQLFSRLTFRHYFDRPEAEDVVVLLDAWRVEHPREREFLTSIAMRPGGGAIRSLTHCLELATILAQDHDEDRNLSLLQSAWAQLSARPVAA